MSSEDVWENLRLMRHLARGVEDGRTPGGRVSNCHLNKHRLINSLWAQVSERSEGLFWDDIPQHFLTTKISRILSESRYAADGDHVTVGRDNLLHQVQPEPRASRLGGLERLTDTGERACRDARPYPRPRAVPGPGPGPRAALTPALWRWCRRHGQVLAFVAWSSIGFQA
jgi:hypothetical protein